MPWLKPPYYKPPKDTCEQCGRSLWGVERYRVEIVVRSGPLKGAVLRRMVVCRDCLEKAKPTGNVKIKYKKLTIL